MFEWVGPAWNILGILSVLTGAVWWLQSQFNNIRTSVRTDIENLQKVVLDKLEYHERHDDERFGGINSNFSERLSNIQDAVWEIRVRNAAIDGIKTTTDIRDRKASATNSG